MNILREELHYRGEDTSRIGALSDSIFGVALTLLVLDLRVPDPTAGVPLASSVLVLWPKFWSYALTFSVVASYWIAHHRMLQLIPRYDRPLLWINFLFLALITLIPIPTSLLGRFGPTAADAQTAWIIYSINLALIGFSLFWLWRLALSNGLVTNVSPRLARYLGVRTLIAPIVFTLSIPLSFATPYVGFSPILILIAFAVLQRRYQRQDD